MTESAPTLEVFPGSLVVTFVVRQGNTTTALVCSPTRFLQGLLNATALMQEGQGRKLIA